MTVRFVGWVLVHAVWQGGAIALMLGAILAFTRRARPAARYLVALSALMATVAFPVLTASRFGDTVVAGERGSLVLPVATLGTAIDRTLPWIVALWCVGLLFLALRFAGGLARVRTLLIERVEPVPREISAFAARTCRMLGIRGDIPLVASHRLEVPVVIGWLRPVVLIPVALLTGLTPSQLETLIAHELAHVRRHDVLVNLLQSAVETILFFHPAVWWISEQVREEREKCCDDLVMRVCRHDVATYATALLALEERRGATPAFVAAASDGLLLRRVRRLVSPGQEQVELGPRWIAGVLAAAATVILLGGRSGPPRPVPALAAATAVARPAIAVDPAPETTDTSAAGRRHSADVSTDANAVPSPNRPSGEDSIARLLASANAEPSRRRARDLVAAVGRQAESAIVVPALVTLFADPSSPDHLREEALEWLARHPLPAALAALAAAARTDEDGEIREQAVAAIGEIALEAAADTLIDLSRSADRRSVRFTALDALGERREPRAVEALAAAAAVVDTASDSRLGRRAVRALGDSKQRTPAMAALLTVARDHPDATMRREAVAAIVDLDDERTIGQLMTVAVSDRDSSVQAAAVEAVGDVHPRVVAIDSLTWVAKAHPHAAVRQVAVRQLGGFRRERTATTVLGELSVSSADPAVRTRAAELLRRRRDGRR
jgi:beta-lactamase regulating signal transducer with metallopeptidase domain/HEAT repeat protein